MAYCLHCDRKARRREGVGPTGRKDWMIMVDTCTKCGRHYPVKPREINLAQKSWIDRWNKRMNQKRVDHDSQPF